MPSTMKEIGRLTSHWAPARSTLFTSPFTNRAVKIKTVVVVVVSCETVSRVCMTKQLRFLISEFPSPIFHIVQKSDLRLRSVKNQYQKLVNRDTKRCRRWRWSVLSDCREKCDYQWSRIHPVKQWGIFLSYRRLIYVHHSLETQTHAWIANIAAFCS